MALCNIFMLSVLTSLLWRSYRVWLRFPFLSLTKSLPHIGQSETLVCLLGSLSFFFNVRMSIMKLCYIVVSLYLKLQKLFLAIVYNNPTISYDLFNSPQRHMRGFAHAPKLSSRSSWLFRVTVALDHSSSFFLKTPGVRGMSWHWKKNC